MTTAASAPSRTPNPILGMLGRGLESALNHGLRLDPDTQGALRAMDGRAIGVEFKGANLAMRIAVEGDQLRVGPALEAESELRISATPGSLLAMAASRLFGDADAPMAPGKVEISGDAELARRIERLASRFEPDIDEAFARTFGDVAGFQIARLVRRFMAALRASGSSFMRDGVEYLVEESRDLVAKPEMEQFFDEVDALRERGDRLEARLRRLDPATRA